MQPVAEEVTPVNLASSTFPAPPYHPTRIETKSQLVPEAKVLAPLSLPCVILWIGALSRGWRVVPWFCFYGGRLVIQAVWVLWEPVGVHLPP